jgi:hypothetical protein
LLAGLDGPAGGLELVVDLLSGLFLGFQCRFPFASRSLYGL